MKPHVAVLHRAPEIAMPFADRIDHDLYSVTYVVTKDALTTVPEGAAAVTVLEDYSTADEAVQALSNRFGHPVRIIARSEYDLMTAAELRHKFGAGGDRPEDVLPFRDKLIMGTQVAAAGIDVPTMAEVIRIEDITEFAENHGFPVIVKPRLGAGSRDVAVVRSPAELSQVADLSAEPYMVQRYCPDPVGHIDGVWTGTDLGPWRASLYVDSCLSFATGGKTLGSVEIDNPALLSEIGHFTAAVCKALSGGRPQVFHLEYFLGHTPDGFTRITFLEIASRVGGTEIAYIWRDLHGYDLLGAALDIQMGQAPSAHEFPDNVFGGFLVIRPQETPPCRVVSTCTDFGAEVQATLFAEAVPSVGTVIRNTTGYLGVGAAFRFQCDTSAGVARSIQIVSSKFTMQCLEVHS